jgi:hypothetical protein
MTEKPLSPILSSTTEHLLSPPHSHRNARTIKILIVDDGPSDGIAAERHTEIIYASCGSNAIAGSREMAAPYGTACCVPTEGG